MTVGWGCRLFGGAIIIFLLATACSKQDPYVPPDLFYYFASYKVGKNPTTITPLDINQDGVTDLMATNVSSNTLSILQQSFIMKRQGVEVDFFGNIRNSLPFLKRKSAG